MLCTIIRLEKLATLRRTFLREGLLCGSTAGHFTSKQCKGSKLDGEKTATSDEEGGSDTGEDTSQERQGFEGRLGDAGPDGGPLSLSSITLAATPGNLNPYSPVIIGYVLIMSLFSRKTVSKRPQQVGVVHQRTRFPIQIQVLPLFRATP